MISTPKIVGNDLSFLSPDSDIKTVYTCCLTVNVESW